MLRGASLARQVSRRSQGIGLRFEGGVRSPSSLQTGRCCLLGWYPRVAAVQGGKTILAIGRIAVDRMPDLPFAFEVAGLMTRISFDDQIVAFHYAGTSTEIDFPHGIARYVGPSRQVCSSGYDCRSNSMTSECSRGPPSRSRPWVTCTWQFGSTVAMNPTILDRRVDDVIVMFHHASRSLKSCSLLHCIHAAV